MADKKYEKMKLSENIVKTGGLYWINYKRKEQKNTKMTGKYQFYSKDKDLLEKIVLDELENNGFQQAKINREEYRKGKDFVLCLYYQDDSRDSELAEKYKNHPNIDYRRWKSNEQTYKEYFSKKSK